MRTSKEFVDNFMQRFTNGDFQKDILSDEGEPLTEDFVNNQVQQFSELLGSKIAKDIMLTQLKYNKIRLYIFLQL